MLTFPKESWTGFSSLVFGPIYVFLKRLGQIISTVTGMFVTFISFSEVYLDFVSFLDFCSKVKKIPLGLFVLPCVFSENHFGGDQGSRLGSSCPPVPPSVAALPTVTVPILCCLPCLYYASTCAPLSVIFLLPFIGGVQIFFLSSKHAFFYSS